MSTKTVQVKPLTLSSNIGTSSTTALVSGLIGLDGADLSQADFGSIIYGTFEPNITREEAVSFTITTNTNGVATIDFGASGRGLIGKAPYGTGGIAYSHSAGSKLVISNNPNLFNKFTAKDNDETVTGQWSFPTPTGASSPATKQYADGLVALGAPEATATSRGISKLSTSPNVTIGTATITIATPAVVSFTSHGLAIGDSIQFTTTGALPTGITASTTYFVIASGFGANSFQISATIGGAAINTTGTQSGVHTLVKTTPIAVGYNDTTKLLTTNEKSAIAGGSNFGSPSSTNKFITQNYNASADGLPVVRTYHPSYTLGGSTSQFNITKSGNDVTYTNTFGTTINLIPVNIGSTIIINGQNFNAANNGTFTVKSADPATNSFTVVNASGIAETAKTIGTGSISSTTPTWSKPVGLKYIIVEGIGAGAGSSGPSSGGGGGYFKKLVQASSLASTETVTVGATGSSVSGGNTTFGSFCTGNGGTLSKGGTATGGDVNIGGGNGTNSGSGGTGGNYGMGGNSFLGFASTDTPNNPATGYGAGAAGANGGATITYGTNGVVIVTEYYS